MLNPPNNATILCPCCNDRFEMKKEYYDDNEPMYRGWCRRCRLTWRMESHKTDKDGNPIKQKASGEDDDLLSF